MTTPDPAAIAASLGKRERDVVVELSAHGPFHEAENDAAWLQKMKIATTASSHLRGRLLCTITPFGRAVAVAIRERERE